LSKYTGPPLFTDIVKIVQLMKGPSFKNRLQLLFKKKKNPLLQANSFFHGENFLPPVGAHLSQYRRNNLLVNLLKEKLLIKFFAKNPSSSLIAPY